MRLVECMGGIWKLSDAAYKRLQRDVAARKELNLDDYGKNLGNVKRLRDLEDEASYEEEIE